MRTMGVLCPSDAAEYWNVDTDYPALPTSRTRSRPVSTVAALVSGHTGQGFDHVREPGQNVGFFMENQAVWSRKRGLLTELPPPDAFSEAFHTSAAGALSVGRPLLQPAMLFGWVLPALVMADSGALTDAEARDWCAADILTIMDYRSMGADSGTRRALLDAARAMSSDGRLRLNQQWLDYADVVVCRAGQRGLAGRREALRQGTVPLFDTGTLSDVELERWAMIDMGLPNWLRRRFVSREGMGLVALPRITNDMSDLMTDVLRGEPGNVFRLRRELRSWFAHYSAWLCGRWRAIREGDCEPAELAAAVTLPYTFLGRRSRTWSKVAAAAALNSRDTSSDCPWCHTFEACVSGLHTPHSVRRAERGVRGGAEHMAAHAVSCAQELVADCGGTVPGPVWSAIHRRVEHHLADAPMARGQTAEFYLSFSRLYGLLAVPFLLIEGGHLGPDTINLMELVGHEYLRYETASPTELATAVYYAMVACHPHPTLSLGTTEVGLLYGEPLTVGHVPCW
ncbi:hypothetical protein ACFXDE_03650 [Kitasatospora sp. NPDC059408]|uniref:hypothetical protein n=1 Tax=Kitasatospora sp. NPDC059408 TaxID=3346823 RepID=UPI0036A24A4E